MTNPQYTYDLDDRPPLRYAVLYGLQWAVIMFPTLIIAAALCSKALHMEVGEEVRFLQLTLLASGLFTAAQSLWGHRYPVLEGPSSAVLLTFIVLAPNGLQVIQGGTLFGGGLLIVLVATGQLKRLVSLATPNVVGVILMLIAFSLLPYLAASMAGVDSAHSNGSLWILSSSLVLIVVIAALSHWLPGIWKTVAILLGMFVGTVFFFAMDFPDWRAVSTARWISAPGSFVPSSPRFHWPVLAAYAASYLAVVVNSLGSLHGIAGVTDRERLPCAVSRGIFINGAAGICCGLTGLVGMVSYSISPGVVLANRVASRYATACGGIILMVAALVPKLAALLAMVPAPVVGAALCVAMGAQTGSALDTVSSAGMKRRDYFVVGLPVLVGTLVGFLPAGLLQEAPFAFRVFMGNGLIIGIVLVLLLEHIVLRVRKPSKSEA